MAYRIEIARNVASDVARFSALTLEYWSASLAEIAADPFPRFGFYVDQRLPIRQFPVRTFLYEITEELSISGEAIFVFVAEFFPEHDIVYVLDEDAQAVLIIYLRAGRY